MRAFNFYKSDDVSNVRLQKYFRIFSDHRVPFRLYGWQRSEESLKFDFNESAHYLIRGGGYGNKKKLVMKYIGFTANLLLFIIKNYKKIQNIENIAVNFDTALVFFVTKPFTKVPYIYEVHDSFALSYSMPSFLKKILMKIDAHIMKNAKYVIHVDKNRILDHKHNNIIIYNSPQDYFSGKFEKRELNHSFAVIGNISEGRGILSILAFAKDNPRVNFTLIGKFYNLSLKQDFVKLNNITYYDYLPQAELFKKILHCCGIFSLYDPALEINRLAASNKVYDAMMLGIPVITNPEVQNSNFIVSEEIGLTVNYNYDESWGRLKCDSFIEVSKRLGTNGRRLFEKEFEFKKMVEVSLLNNIK
ncbi:glycosyltransferase family protein [Pontibacter mangrovi]|uniref:Glycosyltransferase family 4 protein n=1 Tax=Pontibacter mangrovi TaxID=2589816 RepID=A0A501VQG9_9BACT|nr:glycosyltransferase family 4 protein [Pontibacter mangrovi]TPE39983.1 glycosyltransferase family 4 protein [Pontibacter mangrovi]